MAHRIDEKVAPGALQAMLGLEEYVRSSGLEPSLLELVRLRASQMNGCAYCVDMHTKDARAQGKTEQRLYTVAVWQEAPFFTDRERAALAWTEAVTYVGYTHVPDEVYQKARQHFSEKECKGIQVMAVPPVGEIVPDFVLFSTEGARVRISDYRGKRNVVLIFCRVGRSESVRNLLRDLSKWYREFVSEDAELFAVIQGERHKAGELNRSGLLPYPVLMDTEGHVHDRFGAPVPAQDPLPMVCVADRYGEIRHVCRAGDPKTSCGAQEILDWVRFINLECPECGVSDWPA